MTQWYIKVNGAGSAVGHVELPSDANPLTSAKGDKDWFKPATLTKPTPTDFQTMTGPVYDIDAGTITYTVQDISPSSAKVQKLAQLAAYRFEQEVGGITVSSVPVATDRQSQSLMTAARIIAKEDSNYTVNWKATAGFVTLNAATIIAIADAVRGHVQDCFDNEKDHTDAIDALSTAAAVEAYDITTGW